MSFLLANARSIQVYKTDCGVGRSFSMGGGGGGGGGWPQGIDV